MSNFEKALNDPSGIYPLPKDVLADASLSLEQKIKILRQWEYDARELMVAEEENMIGDASSMLQRVLNALHEIAPNYDATRAAGEKHGGSVD